MKRIIEIQQKLKAPKNQYNSFGGYKYRSCEDILEGVKPLLAEFKLCLILKDDIVNVNDRYYVKATATIYDDEGKEIVSSSSMAREELNKKGMDSSQITGATSSYARKYALNGLFAIDDAKDADATNTHNKTEKKAKEIDKMNNDLDIFEGLKSCSDIVNLQKYFKANYKNVIDKNKFIKIKDIKKKELTNG